MVCCFASGGAQPLKTKRLLTAAAIVLFSYSTRVQAATVEYVATDLIDVTPGENLWRYDYRVIGATFLQSEFFDIYFGPALYGVLTAEPAPNNDWDVIVLQQPDLANPPPFDTGIFDSFALTNNPSLTGTFSVTFVYLGSGSPGAQPFEIFDASASTVETGVTSAPAGAVPEPSTAALFLIGFAAWAIHLHRRSAIRR